jgi:hypothetical protein
MKRISTRLIMLALSAALLSSCGENSKPTSTNDTPLPGDPNVTLVVTSITEGSTGARPFETGGPPSFTSPTEFRAGYINAGPPEYLKLTITRIEVDGDTTHDVLWEGEKELLVDGTNVDVSDMSADFNRIHPGTATSVKTTFRSSARIKGSLTADFNTNPSGFTTESLTVYTKAAYPYDAVAHTGGADSYADFTTGPSEEADFWIGGGTTEFTIETPCNAAIGDSSMSQITILIDLNRLLRFYNGVSTTSGPNPPDPADKAYFFGHSLLGTFIAPFFGAPGSIEGYKTVYSAEHPGTNEGVYGWMTLVYGPSGDLMTGMLMGDDDNALTIAKGRVTSFAEAGGGLYNFTYDIAEGTVTGFERVGTIEDYSSVATFVSADTASQHSGEAYFQLLLKQ